MPDGLPRTRALIPMCDPAMNPTDCRHQLAPVVNADCTVRSQRAVNARYRHLVLEAPARVCAVRPGQFVHLLCPGEGEPGAPFLRRPMSVYRATPVEGTFELLYNVVGSGTRALARLRAGDGLRALGPLGRGFSLPPEAGRLLVLARGVGFATLAPLMPLASSLGWRITAVLSARSPADLMLEEFRQGLPMELYTVFDADGSSEVRAVERLLRALIAAGRPQALYTCGSNRLLELLQRLAGEHGISGEVALEQQMACALGVCLACVRPVRGADGGVEPRRVCCDGPVFDLARAVAGGPAH